MSQCCCLVFFFVLIYEHPEDCVHEWRQKKLKKKKLKKQAHTHTHTHNVNILPGHKHSLFYFFLGKYEKSINMQFQNGAAEGGVLCIYTAEIVLFSVHCCIKTQMLKQRPSNKVLRRFWPAKVPLLSLTQPYNLSEKTSFSANHQHWSDCRDWGEWLTGGIILNIKTIPVIILCDFYVFVRGKVFMCTSDWVMTSLSVFMWVNGCERSFSIPFQDIGAINVNLNMSIIYAHRV